MKRIINFALTFGVLYFANKFFPNQVDITDINMVLLATVILFGANQILGWITVISGVLIPVGVGCLTIIPSIFLLVFSTPLTLYLMNKNLDGFSINGFITFLLLWAMIGIFSISISKNNTNTIENK